MTPLALKFYKHCLTPFPSCIRLAVCCVLHQRTETRRRRIGRGLYIYQRRNLLAVKQPRRLGLVFRSRLRRWNETGGRFLFIRDNLHNNKWRYHVDLKQRTASEMVFGRLVLRRQYFGGSSLRRCSRRNLHLHKCRRDLVIKQRPRRWMAVRGNVSRRIHYSRIRTGLLLIQQLGTDLDYCKLRLYVFRAGCSVGRRQKAGDRQFQRCLHITLSPTNDNLRSERLRCRRAIHYHRGAAHRQWGLHCTQ